MCTIFNSLSGDFKSPVGPIKEKSKLILRIRLNKSLSPQNVQVIFNEHCSNIFSYAFNLDFEKESDDLIYFKVEIEKLDVNIYHYFFKFYSFGKVKFITMCDNSWEAYISDYNNLCNWQLTVYKAVKTHKNMTNGVMYQIFPDRFNRGHKNKNLPPGREYRKWGELPYFSDDTICKDFFCGDIQGIIEKLEYLKSLNVSVIYLNPIWEASENHRYNTGCYENVDPVLGTNEDLKQFTTLAHQNGIIVILDTVLNHTGSNSMYFNKDLMYPNIGAFNSKSSPYYSWYYFYGEDKNNYDSWWGFKTLPKLKQSDPELINYFFSKGGILDKWFNLGIDGLRLDVADELENSTLELINSSSKRNKDEIVIIGEVWDNASNKCNYGHRMNYFLGNQLTSVMNYPLKDAILAYIRYGYIWANNLKMTLISIFIEDYPKEIAYSLMNFLSTHDTVRAITKLAGKEVDNHDKKWQYENDILTSEEYKIGRSRLMLSYFFIFFLPGIPSIYYGDEIGLYGQKDPFCRKCFTWDRIDKKILRFFKSLTVVRSKYSDFLSEASFNFYNADNEISIYLRSLDKKCLVVVVNRSDSRVSISGKLSDIIETFCNISNNTEIDITFSIGKNSSLDYLNPFGAILIEIKN